MKKILLSLALLAGLGVGLVYATDIVPVPLTQTGVPADVNYAGVDLSTSMFSSGLNFIRISTPTYSEIAVFGVVFSSGAGESFVVFRDTDSAATPTSEAFRLYNSSNMFSGSTTGTQQFLKVPARFKKGLLWSSNSALFNSVTVFYKLK